MHGEQVRGINEGHEQHLLCCVVRYAAGRHCALQRVVPGVVSSLGGGPALRSATLDPG